MTFDIEIRSHSYVKVIGQGSRSHEEKCMKMKLKFEKNQHGQKADLKWKL